MKVTLQALLLAILSLVSSVPLTAQVGTWRNYLAYSEPQQIVAASGNDIFVLASNSLYQYNTADGQITTYDKVNGMNGVGITNIAWNKTAKRLIATYSDSNIDIVDTDGNVVNISGLYDKSTTDDKTINTIYINDRYAYLCTNFGIVKVDMMRAEISETYNLQMQINAATINGNNILARTTSGIVFTAQTNTNLQDPANWQQTSNFTASMFDRDLTDWNKYIDVVRTLKPGGPKYNNFGFIKFFNNKLYTCGGGYGINYQLNRSGCIQILDDDWTFIEEGVQEITGADFLDMTCVSVDPLNSQRLIASGRTGVYEFTNNTLTNYWNYHNSPLRSARSITDGNKNYTLVMYNIFDKNGNMWCYNSRTSSTSLACLNKEVKWETFDIEGLMGLDMVSFILYDSKGYLWIVNEHWNMPSVYCYDPEKKVIVYYIKKLVNQDGVVYNNFTPYCVAEDINGNHWLGTSVGTFLIESLSNDYVTQIKVPRNDGTNYADYLMANIATNCIVFDGGNRKWIGTKGNGVYMISTDNMTQLEHFTTDNSPLLSNNIESLTINQQTGELFIGTEDGLCSYMTDATIAATEMIKDNVYAYPNPVTSDYAGLITIVGLSIDADVKILSSSGQLVAQGRSNGGSFTWNAKDVYGRHVASGIYMVSTATNDGKKGIVCKIAIIN